MTREEVKLLMESSNSEQEWNTNCDKVKKAFNGYPDFWFADIIMSGLCGQVSARFGKDDRIHIMPIDISN